MVETLAVGLIVLVAFGYSAWALMPRALRLKLARALVARSGGTTSSRWLNRLALRLERAAGGGGHCADCSAARSPPAAPAAKRPPAN